MFNSISESTRQTFSVGDGSICDAGIANQMVMDSVDALLSRVVTDYLSLLGEAKENPGIIHDYKSSLSDYYLGQTLSPEAEQNLREAQEIAPNCNVIKKNLPSDGRISVFSEKNMKLDENQTLANARVHIRLKINAKSIQEEDSLDLLLSQLSKKILSLGYGNEGTFDIRLEKGCLALEGSSWKGHFDGNIFKTSITVCYSNKENWSTHILDFKQESKGRPADHGFLYDALKVFHRTPVPADLEGKELNADDYRLFIRYTEFYTSGDQEIVSYNNVEENRSVPKIPFVKKWDLEVKIPSLLPYEVPTTNTEFASSLNKNLLNQHLHSFVVSQPISIEKTLAKHYESLETFTQPVFIPHDFSQILTPSTIYYKDEVQLQEPSLIESNPIVTLPPIDTNRSEQLIPCRESSPKPRENTPPCAVM